ncbi:hypothetical protein [Clostridium saccharoperbutylacetonicum]
MNNNLLKVLETLKKFGVKSIYLNDELKDFDEFIKEFASMEIENVLEEEQQAFYILLSNGIWNKVSVKSLEEEEELAI